MKCVICQHLKRCSVVMMRLLFLSEELNWGKGAWLLKGVKSNSDLLGIVRGSRSKGSSTTPRGQRKVILYLYSGVRLPLPLLRGEFGTIRE